MENPEEIKKEIVSYENLYAEMKERRSQLDMVNCPKFSEVENSILEVPF